MKEFAWVVLLPDGNPAAISQTEAAAWERFFGVPVADDDIRRYQDMDYRCIRVRMFEVGPA